MTFSDAETSSPQSRLTSEQMQYAVSSAQEQEKKTT